jgi:hypothetical protein
LALRARNALKGRRHERLRKLRLMAIRATITIA